MKHVKTLGLKRSNIAVAQPQCSQRSMKRFSAFLIIISLLAIPSLLPAAESLVKAGWIEEVRIYPGDLLMHAKLDTGAENASIHAEDIDHFERDGHPWVRFTIKDRTSKNVTLERKVHRIAKIKRHKQKAAERPVILLDICLGDTYKQTEVNLANRSNYEYELLIGRVFLTSHFTIDPSSRRTLEPNCKKPTSK
ncbi:MAG: hypothetical protein NPIRA02_42160 [Nitrospirales bacterium]|nr:MAG: hypothetical protein NPIRA02_42160 [Nitrospirales bacterium]